MTSSTSLPGWSLTDGRAAWLHDEPPSTVDLERPQAGIGVLESPIAAADRLLGIDLDAACHRIDAWCRGADLTAVYEPDAGGRVRTTAMWRATPPWRARDAWPGVWCRELVVSAQTALLESAPRIAVVCDVAAGHPASVRCVDGRLVAAGRHGPAHGFVVAGRGPRTLLFLVHPADAGATDARAEGGRLCLRARVFPAAVEKGVLLRSRVVAALGPSNGDIPAWAHGLAAAFAASPPVLTT